MSPPHDSEAVKRESSPWLTSDGSTRVNFFEIDPADIMIRLETDSGEPLIRKLDKRSIVLGRMARTWHQNHPRHVLAVRFAEENDGSEIHIRKVLVENPDTFQRTSLLEAMKDLSLIENPDNRNEWTKYFNRSRKFGRGRHAWSQFRKAELENATQYLH